MTMRLGAMHLIMAFLVSIGKIFGDGGLQNILTSSDVYAAATVNQMLQGKQVCPWNPRCPSGTRSSVAYVPDFS